MEFDLSSLTREGLEERYKQLSRELSQLKAGNQAMWALLVEISRRMQISSASIKAAVTSLLDHDIFWDDSSQHEFLETIDNSVDHTSGLILLVSLAFRLEAGSLELAREHQVLQEILSLVRERLAQRLPGLLLRVIFPTEGDPVMVDYEYLVMALSLLIEAFYAIDGDEKVIYLNAVEEENDWRLTFDGVDPRAIQAFDDIVCGVADLSLVIGHVSSENVLKMCIAQQIFDLQGISIPARDKTSMDLLVPKYWEQQD